MKMKGEKAADCSVLGNLPPFLAAYLLHIWFQVLNILFWFFLKEILPWLDPLLSLETLILAPRALIWACDVTVLILVCFELLGLCNWKAAGGGRLPYTHLCSPWTCHDAWHKRLNMLTECLNDKNIPSKAMFMNTQRISNVLASATGQFG